MMHRVRVNQTKHGIRDGVPVFIKRRRAGSGIVIWFGNRFLALARSGVCMFVRADEWMEWEVYCSGLLYPDRPCVKIGPGESVSIAVVNGTSLRQLIGCGQTDLKPIVAAARELRRVHQIECRCFRAAWSHGDLHLDNILYDRTTDRAILIDFDTRHEFGIDQTRRHSDDLNVFLLEMIAICNEKWFELATAFVEEYRESSILHELNRQLFVPRGFARILWLTRTNGASMRHIEQRMECLRQKLCQVTALACH
jgi:hypothetical protein